MEMYTDTVDIHYTAYKDNPLHIFYDYQYNL